MVFRAVEHVIAAKAEEKPATKSEEQPEPLGSGVASFQLGLYLALCATSAKYFCFHIINYLSSAQRCLIAIIG